MIIHGIVQLQHVSQINTMPKMKSCRLHACVRGDIKKHQGHAAVMTGYCHSMNCISYSAHGELLEMGSPVNRSTAAGPPSMIILAGCRVVSHQTETLIQNYLAQQVLQS